MSQPQKIYFQYITITYIKLFKVKTRYARGQNMLKMTECCLEFMSDIQPELIQIPSVSRIFTHHCPLNITKSVGLSTCGCIMWFACY